MLRFKTLEFWRLNVDWSIKNINSDVITYWMAFDIIQCGMLKYIEKTNSNYIPIIWYLNLNLVIISWTMNTKLWSMDSRLHGDRRRCDRMLVGFITTYAIWVPITTNVVSSNLVPCVKLWYRWCVINKITYIFCIC